MIKVKKDAKYLFCRKYYYLFLADFFQKVSLIISWEEI